MARGISVKQKMVQGDMPLLHEGQHKNKLRELALKASQQQNGLKGTGPFGKRFRTKRKEMKEKYKTPPPFRAPKGMWPFGMRSTFDLQITF
jgi:hypothetical protein